LAVVARFAVLGAFAGAAVWVAAVLVLEAVDAVMIPL